MIKIARHLSLNVYMYSSLVYCLAICLSRKLLAFINIAKRMSCAKLDQLSRVASMPCGYAPVGVHTAGVSRRFQGL